MKTKRSLIFSCDCGHILDNMDRHGNVIRSFIGPDGTTHHWGRDCEPFLDPQLLKNKWEMNDERDTICRLQRSNPLDEFGLRGGFYVSRYENEKWNLRMDLGYFDCRSEEQAKRLADYLISDLAKLNAKIEKFLARQSRKVRK